MAPTQTAQQTRTTTQSPLSANINLSDITLDEPKEIKAPEEKAAKKSSLLSHLLGGRNQAPKNEPVQEPVSLYASQYQEDAAVEPVAENEIVEETQPDLEAVVKEAAAHVEEPEVAQEVVREEAPVLTVTAPSNDVSDLTSLDSEIDELKRKLDELMKQRDQAAAQRQQQLASLQEENKKDKERLHRLQQEQKDLETAIAERDQQIAALMNQQ